MKIKIVQDCRLALSPHQPYLVFRNGEELDVDNTIGFELLKAKHAVEIEVKTDQPVNDARFRSDQNELTEKALTPDYENKSLGHQKKLSNKTKFSEGAK